jgi:hypothetical protein
MTDLCYHVVFFLTKTFKLFSFLICQQINVYKGQPNLTIEDKGNNKITELQTILQRASKNS